MEDNEGLWKTIVGSEPVSLFGFQYEVGLEPVPVSVDRMLKAFELGLKEFIPLWDGVLPQEVLSELKAMYPVTPAVKFADDLWVRVIYGFAIAAHRKAMTREHLLRSFTPLYLGRVASFVLETQECGHGTVEAKIEELCKAFECQKSYLIQQWDQPSTQGGAP
jgi:hypothetical protein